MIAKITAWMQARRYNQVMQEQKHVKPIDRFNKGPLTALDANAISRSVIEALSEEFATFGYWPSLDSVREIHKHPWLSIQHVHDKPVAHQVDVSVHLEPDAFHADYPNAKTVVRSVRLNLEIR